MKNFFAFLVCLLVTACAQPPWVGVVVTNAPGSLGNCMPEKPAGVETAGDKSAWLALSPDGH